MSVSVVLFFFFSFIHSTLFSPFEYLHAFGLSVQVKTCLKPQERTSSSTSLLDFVMLDVFARVALEDWGWNLGG